MTLLDDVDLLYAGCVTDPDRWNDQAFADWADAVAQGHELDRELARGVRRCLSVGRKLARFWQQPDRPGGPEDWRQRVDVAMGNRAWRPQLELATLLLEREPDPDVFDRVAALFPVVNHQPFHDGITYDEWVQDHLPGGARG